MLGSNACSGIAANILNFILENSYGRDVVEPAIKPGESALVCPA